MQKPFLRVSRQTSNGECDADAEHEMQRRTERVQTNRFCSIARKAFLCNKFRLQAFNINHEGDAKLPEAPPRPPPAELPPPSLPLGLFPGQASFRSISQPCGLAE